MIVRRLAFLRPWPLIAAGLVMLPAVLWWWLNLNPRVDIAAPTMPSPNAFDFYVAAGQSLIDTERVGELCGPAEPEQPAEPGEIKRILAANAAALATMRQGQQHEYLHPQATSFGTLFPHLAKFRGLARLLAVESRSLAAEGQPAKALASAIDGIQLGIDAPRGAPLIGALVGVAIESIDRLPAWELLDQLDGPTAAAAAERLEALEARRCTRGQVMGWERDMGALAMMEVLRRPGWRFEMSGLIGESDAGPWANLRFMLVNERRSMRLYLAYFDEVIAYLDAPPGSRPAPPDAEEYSRRDPLLSVSLPVFAQVGTKLDLSAAQTRLLCASLAVRAYQSAHGGPPRALADLVPEYLRAVPADPLGNGELGYRRAGSRYVLYSVGPDHIDDGGRAIVPREEEQYVTPDATGDIVAGVNLR